MPSFQITILGAYYVVGAISILLGLLSLRGGLKFVSYLQQELGGEVSEFTPFATVIVPCRGVDEGLKENIAAIFEQDYPLFEIIFVTDRADDPSLAVIDEARRCFQRDTGPIISTMVAGPATDSGQKVHNLRAASMSADSQSEVFVFTDTDARPQKFWLRALIAPLRDAALGAATGYRWFVPVRGGFASHLQSVWNASIASALGERDDKNFCWGGSMAIRRETFERLDVAEHWRGTVSDDFTLTRVLQKARLPIKFVPRCLMPSFEDTTFRRLVEFSNRQFRITRVYAPHLWKPVLTGGLLFALAFFGGLALVASRVVAGVSFFAPLAIVLMIFVLGSMKAHLRLRAVAMFISHPTLQTRATAFAQVFLWPVSSLLFLYNALAAISRRITWRGITYELKSPTETVILSHEPD